MNRKDEIQIYEYSAILDENTCKVCEAADGMQSKDMAELPEAPNPGCHDRANCRCFIVAVYQAEQN